MNREEAYHIVEYVNRRTVCLVTHRFCDISAPLCVGDAQVSIYYNHWTSVRYFEKNAEDVLQARLTVLMKTTRKCGGTSAKLIICVGVYTALWCVRWCQSD
jgi:hypothetical protein